MCCRHLLLDLLGQCRDQVWCSQQLSYDFRGDFVSIVCCSPLIVRVLLGDSIRCLIVMTGVVCCIVFVLLDSLYVWIVFVGEV